MIPAILARIDIGQIFGILILVASIVSWLANTIKGNGPDGRPRPPRPKAKPPNGQSEIEILLQELATNKPKQVVSKPPGNTNEAQPARPPVERPRPKAPPSKSRASTQTPPQAARSQVRIADSKLRVADSKLPTTDLGAGVRKHNLGNRVEAAVEKEIKTAVSNDLGARTATLVQPVVHPVHPLVKSLRDPDGVRQAVLVNEILQRPKALRR